MAKPIIYWHPNSPPCRGTWLCLKNLGVDVDFRILKLAENEQYRPEFLAINPMHCVPTLDDNGFVLWESRAISTYFANAKETLLYPSDRTKRGLIDARLYFDATVMHLRLRAITRPILYEGVTTITEEKWTAITEAYVYLENFLIKSDFVAGNDVSLADLHLLSTVAVAKHLGCGFEKHPKLSDWYERCRKYVRCFDEHEEFVKNYVVLIRSKLK